ncbi:MAG: acetylglucosamine-6-sulfatase [Lentisphaerae bacterium]|nr:MAG: acetylglucosamine-6-sulfatase [Lentisphaerota bacterium]
MTDQHQAVIPVIQDKPWYPSDRWLQRHEMLLARAKRVASAARVVFLGDSITEGWCTTGKNLWDEFFAGLPSINLGISGDETQHVLWRIEHGILDPLQPQHLILLIGTNNLGNSGHEPSMVSDGIRSILDAVRQRLPDTTIWLISIFPRDREPDTELRRKISIVNQTISTFDNHEDICFLDFSDIFLDDRGYFREELTSDFLHLNEAGYRIFAEALCHNIPFHS